MVQFWRSVVIGISITLISSVYAVEKESHRVRSSLPIASSSSLEDRAQLERENNFKEIYKALFSYMKKCNMQAHCRGREVCLAEIQTLFKNMLDGKRLLQGKKTVLTESDMSSLITEAYDLAVKDIFYATLLLVRKWMSPRGWQNYKNGQRIAADYLQELAAPAAATQSPVSAPVSTQIPALPLDIDKDAISILLMQMSFPDDESVCSKGVKCYSYNTVTKNIDSVIADLKKVNLVGVGAIINKLSSLYEAVLETRGLKEKNCPAEILQAIRSRLSPRMQFQLEEELKSLRGFTEVDDSKLTNKEIFDAEREGAAPKQKLRFINPALEGANQTQKNDLLKKMYAAVTAVQAQCAGACLDKVHQSLVSIKKTMEPADPRQLIVDYYVKSMNALINEVVYQGALFIRDTKPDVWKQYKSGIRVKDSEYFADLRKWSTALSAPAGLKKTDQNPKINQNAIKIDRLAILNILMQYLIREENSCKDRNAWSAAAKKAFVHVRSTLFANIPGSVEMAAELDSLLNDMIADEQNERSLVIASAMRRELPSDEQAKLNDFDLKDKEIFNKEMKNATKELHSVNPAQKMLIEGDTKDSTKDGANFEKQLTTMAQDFGKEVLGNVLKAVTAATK